MLRELVLAEELQLAFAVASLQVHLEREEGLRRGWCSPFALLWEQRVAVALGLGLRVRLQLRSQLRSLAWTRLEVEGRPRTVQTTEQAW